MDVLHVCLNVSDADRAANWYVDELGFERSREFELPDSGKRNLYVTDGNGFELQLADEPGETDFEQGTAWDHLAVEVDDVDEAFERITDHGVVHEPTDVPPAEARVAFVRDPDGHVIELVGPLEE